MYVNNLFSSLYVVLTSLLCVMLWMLAVQDVAMSGFLSSNVYSTYHFHPISLLSFTIVFGLAAMRRQPGTSDRLEVFTAYASIFVTLFLSTLCFWRLAQMMDIFYLNDLNEIFGGISDVSHVSVATIFFLNLLHMSDAHFARSKAIYFQIIVYTFVVSVSLLSLSHVAGLLIHQNYISILSGYSAISATLTFSFSLFIAPRLSVVKSVFGRGCAICNMIYFFTFCIVVLAMVLSQYMVNISEIVLLISVVVLILVPLGIVKFLSSRKYSFPGDFGSANETHYKGRWREFGLSNILNMDGHNEREKQNLNLYSAVWLGEKEVIWQRLLLQGVIAFVLSYVAILLSRQFNGAIANIWWANVYVAYCLLFYPVRKWLRPVIFLYASVLFANLVSGNNFRDSSILGVINVVESTFISILAIFITAILARSSIVKERIIYIFPIIAFILSMTLVMLSFSIIGGSFVTYRFGGSLAQNIFVWGSGSINGGFPIAVYFLGRLIQRQFIFGDHVQSNTYKYFYDFSYLLFAAIALVFVDHYGQDQWIHILFILMSILLCFLPSLVRAGGLLLFITFAYIYLGSARSYGDTSPIEYSFFVWVVSSCLGVVFILRYSLLRSKFRQSELLENLSVGWCALDGEFHILKASVYSEMWFDCGDKDLLGKSFLSLFDNNLELKEKILNQFLDDHIESRPLVAHRSKPNGERLIFEVLVRRADGFTPKPAYNVSLRLVTNESAGDETRQQISDVVEAFMKRGSQYFCIEDSNYRVVAISEAQARRLHHASPEALIGKDVIELAYEVPEDIVERRKIEDAELLKTGEVTNYYTMPSPEDGSLLHLRAQITKIDLVSGDYLRCIVITDVSDLMQTQEKLQNLVYLDELTGLLSRRGMYAKFGDGQRSLDLCMVLLDLDFFKSVNDSYGHGAGDELLISVSRALKEICSDDGAAVRLGGEEFIVLFPWEDWVSAQRRSEHISRVIADSSVIVEDHKISRTASLGYGLLQVTDDFGSVLRFVDLAQREAKETGRNKIIAANEDFKNILISRGSFISGEELKTALFNGEIHYYVQPVWDVESQEIYGFEALIRWQKPDGRILLPGLFVPLLYEVTRDARCVEQKFKLRADVLTALSDFPDAFVSFNFSLDQLSFVGAAKNIISSFNSIKDHSGRKIKIELSEKALHDRVQSEVLARELEQLHAAGYHIALDDFGVESSNLNRLQHYPIDTLKLDKVLIDHIATETRQKQIVTGIARMMAALDLTVIAEGVETCEQVEFLKSIDVRYQQGFVHARPMLPNEVHAQLKCIGAKCTPSKREST